MQTLHTIAEVRARVRAWQQAGDTVAFVPTMGNLHDGHITLVREGRKLAQRVVASVFVNPTQFGPNEDFDKYPRTLKEDSGKLAAAGCDVLFAPSVDEMYPNGKTQTVVHVPGLGEALCGRSRPGHFDGVSTVVSKLFHIVPADVALFGEKDFQQLAIIRRMAADLCFPVRIVGVPTVREPSGLAMSSRNGYLTAEQKATAAVIYRSLVAARDAILGGRRDYPAVAAEATRNIEGAGLVIDYIEVRNGHDLSPARPGDDYLVIAAAAKLGSTRLIDNVAFFLGNS
ncbi:MAG: pantoate--beta-alanine ligase [Gammaproteobacteria bacterium]